LEADGRRRRRTSPPKDEREALVERIRPLLSKCVGVREVRMFGGLCFMVSGNMCCGVSANRLLVRVGPLARDAMLERPHTSPMIMRGKVVSAFIFVKPEGLRTDADLKGWVQRGIDFVSGLPPKPDRNVPPG
jgi:TfoX/Sxy family transcriptional regulator of competence genes